MGKLFNILFIRICKNYGLQALYGTVPVFIIPFVSIVIFGGKIMKNFGDRKGVSAIEFALLFPILMSFFLMMLEVGYGFIRIQNMEIAMRNSIQTSNPLIEAKKIEPSADYSMETKACGSHTCTFLIGNWSSKALPFGSLVPFSYQSKIMGGI